ncbi:putative uncharacterized protein [Taylorella equigenitalis 14/56]|uniref:Uncharacterized protein n=2 Tax=Taylorella equigenitalis TaxID=29575 RepID=I7IZN3_9BURK|nr:putative uncharacterized protein [Taylorella equigenitalis 14/56]
MTMKKLILFSACFLLLNNSLKAQDETSSFPKFTSRTYEQNYRDLVLSACIAWIYNDNPAVKEDVLETEDALNNATSYDIENNTGKFKEIIDIFTINSNVNTKRKANPSKLLNCLDLYHSEELNACSCLYITIQ